MLGDANVILRGRGRRHYVRNYPGPLSIKTVQRGSGVWKTAEGEFRVDESSFLVLNAGQPYSLTLESPQTIETCCVFFQKAFLDVFPTRLWASDARILPRLRSLYRSGDDEDQLVLLARDLAALIREARGERHRVPGRRATTRDEMYRRLGRAREYLHASYLEPVSLDDLARVAGVSPYHFHRAFTRVFGQTPQQYRTRLRLDRAQQLLRPRRAAGDAGLPGIRLREPGLLQYALPPPLRLLPPSREKARLKKNRTGPPVSMSA